MTTLDIDNNCLEPKRKNTLTKEETYMMHALIAASNSKDPSTQVGACYVSENGKILSVGCNQAPPRWDEDEFPWGTKEEYGKINCKYTYVIHAEMSGSTNYSGSVNDFKNSTLYVTLFPCSNCAKLIASLGVKKIVYLNARKDTDDYIYSRILLKKSHVECADFRQNSNSALIQMIELDINANEKDNIKIKRKTTNE